LLEVISPAAHIHQSQELKRSIPFSHLRGCFCRFSPQN